MIVTTGAPTARPKRNDARGQTPARTTEPPRTPAISEAVHRALLAQPAIDVVVCDAKGIVTAMSPNLGDLARQAHGPMHIDDWPRRCHLHGERSETPLNRAENPLAIALSGHSVTDAPLTMTPPGAPTRFLRCSAVPLVGPDGDALGGLAVLIDVTAQAALQRTIEEMHHLLETVNHEVRTPLACVVGHVELLADLATDLRGDARWSWEALVRGAARLQSAVDNITAQVCRTTMQRRAQQPPKGLSRPFNRPAPAESPRDPLAAGEPR